MKQSFFFDNRPFIYIFSGLLGYLLGVWMVFSIQYPNIVTLGLDEHGCLIRADTPIVYSVVQDHSERIVSPVKDFLNWHPALLKWGLFIGLLMAFAAAILTPAALLNVKLIQDFALHQNAMRNAKYLTAAVVLGCIYFWVIPNVNNALLIPQDAFKQLNLFYPSEIERLFLIPKLIISPGILCLLGLLLVNFVIIGRNLNILPDRVTSLDFREKKIDAAFQTALQKELQKYFRFFSISISILIAGGMITSSLLRDVVYSFIVPASLEVTASPEWKAIAPSEHIVIYGLNQMVFLAAVLIPSFFFIHRSGQLALKSIQLQNHESGLELADMMSPQKMQLQKIWLSLLILAPFLGLFANKLLAFLAGQLE